MRRAQPLYSMGQPLVWKPYLTAVAVAGGNSAAGGAAAFGLRRPILNPVTGLLSASAEVVGEWKAGSVNGGVRALANVPSLAFGAGVDWNVNRGEVDPLFVFETAIRRGGLLGGGSMLRAEWLPTRDQTFALGVKLPLRQPLAGRTRPKRTNVDLPGSVKRYDAPSILPDSLERALATVAEAVTLIRAYNNLWFDDDRAVLERGARLPYGHSYSTVSAAYWSALSDAFRLAGADRAIATRVARRARAEMLERVIMPYNALYGQAKAQPDISGLIEIARDGFVRWLGDSSNVASAAHARVVVVFDRWADAIASLQQQLVSEWKDSRLVWLPPTLALTPDEYDEQSEVDALIGRAVGHPFTDDNALAYLRTADLPLEIARSIAATQNYHVLWTHDFCGRRETGELDAISYTLVADAYLPALTKAVERYDSTGVLPQYVILLDAFYYHGRGSKVWMDILESPLDPRVAMRADEQKQADHIRRRVADLRAAVARSKRLQQDASSRGGEKWLKDVVRVHVSIVQPSDFAFRSIRIMPPFPFIPDNAMRDHRKMVLYDFTEADPYAGAMIVTGIGIGEHYSSVTWEDRGIRVRGSAALEARAAARRVLRYNGLREDQIPPGLRVSSGQVAAGMIGQPRRDVARALHVHNENGLATKSSSIARAMLYSLAPPGSVIIVPDPLWLSETWGAMLAGAAARGSTVAIIAPALANAPSPQAPLMVLARNVMIRLNELRGDVERRANGSGALHVGLYAASAPATDIAGRLEEVRAGLRKNPWIREVIPFDANAIRVLDAANTAAVRTETSRPAIANDVEPRKPQLHQKTQFIARPGAIAALLRQPGWDRALARALRSQAEGTARLSDAIGSEAPPPDTAAARATEEMLDGYERSMNEEERKRVSFYFAVGTQNHDLRSLMIDGEASVLVSGFQASAGLVDLYYLMARTTWIESAADIDRLVPPPKGLLARVARMIRDLM
jgi:hypothetical protein